MLVEEYNNQNNWRAWERYLNKIPLDRNQAVYDLGCSIGVVAKLFSHRVKSIVGFDNDPALLAKANINKPDNCNFTLANIFTLDPGELRACDGIWLSYTLAYMEDPQHFIASWLKCLNANGWFAIVDIDGLFSCHLPQTSKFRAEIELFEQHSALNKVYDFRVGGKIKSLLEQNSLEVIVAEDDWYDEELNFSGKASQYIVAAWQKRLARMKYLKSYMGEKYTGFTKEFLAAISREDHQANGGVKFYVGIKR
jgi:Trans-aconitate methyltransferase